MTSDDQYPTTSDAVRAAIEAEEAGQQADDQEAPAPVGIRAGLLAALAASDAHRQARRQEAAENSRTLQAELGVDDTTYARLLDMGQADFEAFWQDQMRAEGFPDLHGPMGQMRAALAKHAGISVRMPPAPVRPSVVAEALAGRPELLAELVPGARTAAQVEADESAAGQARNEDGTFAAQGEAGSIADGIRRATNPTTQRIADLEERVRHLGGHPGDSGIVHTYTPADAAAGRPMPQGDKYQPARVEPSSGSLAIDAMKRLMGRR